MLDVVSTVAAELSLRPQQVGNTMELLEAGNTVPFITRYRKEMTGALDEEQIRSVAERLAHHKMLEERKNTVLEQIQSQGKLTPELELKIREADRLKDLEDLYLPYKPKKRTLATAAREKGLGPLAQAAWEQATDDASWTREAENCVDPGRELESLEKVLEGVGHILAETVAEEASVRQKAREIFWQRGFVRTRPSAEEEKKGKNSRYRDYFEFAQSLKEIPPHRILAVNRGEKEKALRVGVDVPEDEILGEISRRVIRSDQPRISAILQSAVADGYRRLLGPSLCREVRSDLAEKAELHAIHVFAENLKKLLLSPPVRGRRILGVDPGMRTGCKLAVVDELGKLLDTDVMYLHAAAAQKEKAEEAVLAKIREHRLDLVVIGNGTAHREVEEFISELIAKHALPIEYAIVNEAGASVYSVSKEAQEEFPTLDASYRGTVSIARRIQDPLAEIVKIDPKSIGVGLYQHDVNQKELSGAVDAVVESCVNYVGVDLNTASASLLEHISGLNRSKARKIYEWRLENGRFSNRKDILAVKGIGPDTFVQAAGFLRIPDGENPLDNTGIHPESYEKASLFLSKMGLEASGIADPKERRLFQEKLADLPLDRIASELEIGGPTLRDIVENLKKPGRDPREDLPKPAFRRGVLKLEDLQPGMEMQGTVRNVVDFGAFVDIGVKHDGLVHISEMSDRYVKNPQEVVSVGDIVTVSVLEVDLPRQRIALSLRSKSKGPAASDNAPEGNAGKAPEESRARETAEPKSREKKFEKAPKPPKAPKVQEPAKPQEEWKEALKKLVSQGRDAGKQGENPG